jgi:catechol 2,3-dioxygenase-like lactoylglutathione lyase family enzyme
MSITQLEHVLVLSEDIEQTRDFYAGVVGLRVGDRPALQFPGYWLYAGATACVHVADRRSYRAHAATLGLDVDASSADGDGGGIDHIAFVATDYDELTARLERAGITPVRNDVPGGGPRQLFFSDPNGVRIELSVRSPNRSEVPDA